jgi:PadR family transcriptional regulator, regulatory protein PadR
MRESTYFVLAALRGQRLHGYAVIKRAADLSGGRVRLAAGTLYAALDRLAGEGYVIADGEEVVNGRARRYYVLTGPGEAAVQAEAARMAAAAKVVTDGRAARTAPVVRPA